MNEQDRRAALRHRYAEHCGYCTVHESEAGSELEVDHFQPRSAGGLDELDNLIYCCPACNRLKGDFWPATDPYTAIRRLLHPGRDDLREHLREEADGRLIALTETGTFHLERLRLNRPPLVALRLSRREVARLREDLADARLEQAGLNSRLAVLERELQSILSQIGRLLKS